MLRKSYVTWKTAYLSKFCHFMRKPVKKKKILKWNRRTPIVVAREEKCGWWRSTKIKWKNGKEKHIWGKKHFLKLTFTYRAVFNFNIITWSWIDFLGPLQLSIHKNATRWSCWPHQESRLQALISTSEGSFTCLPITHLSYFREEPRVWNQCIHHIVIILTACIHYKTNIGIHQEC